MSAIAWALHSEYQDALVEACIPKLNVTWDTYRDLGIAFWVRKKETLESLLLRMAQDSYRKTKNPANSLLWYLVSLRLFFSFFVCCFCAVCGFLLCIVYFFYASFFCPILFFCGFFFHLG